MKSKLFSLIISVLAAMCLWVYVMTVVNPDVDLTIGNIPVTFSGAEVLREDHGLVTVSYTHLTLPTKRIV